LGGLFAGVNPPNLSAADFEPKPADPYFVKFLPLKAPAPTNLLLQPGDRLAIIGDSITEQKMYSRIIETYLTVCVPELKITARQFGWGGETAEVFGGAFHGRKDADSVAELAAFLRARIVVDRVIVHPNDGAACASADSTVYVTGPHCREPLISTGAGDNFGAGCLAAALKGLDDAGIVLAGICASGHFVRSGRSASFANMAKLLDAWTVGTLGERLFSGH
jgi:hypothetical protein